jgi:hypothetical protein
MVLLIAGGVWLLNDMQDLQPDIDGSVVGIEATIDANRLSLSRNRIVNPGIVVIHVRNADSIPRVLNLFQVADPAAIRARIAAPPSGGETAFTGEIVLPPATEGDLVLVDLEPDDYTIVVDLRSEDGTLLVRDAFSTTLTIASGLTATREMGTLITFVPKKVDNAACFTEHVVDLQA